MSEAEILGALKQLHEQQAKVCQALKEAVDEHLDKDELAPAYSLATACRAAYLGDFHAALKAVGGTE